MILLESNDLFIEDNLISQAKIFIKKYTSKFLVGINLEGAVKGKKISFSELYRICEGLHKKDNKPTGHLKLFLKVTLQLKEYLKL